MSLLNVYLVAIFFNLFSSDLECSTFYLSSNKKQEFGINHSKNIIEICKADSTFKQTDYSQSRSWRKIFYERKEEHKGKWQIRQDTLTLTWLSEDYGPISHNYIINGKKLYYFHYDPHKKGGINKSKYKWRLIKGDKIR